jgi:uncharacterized protein
MSSALHNAAMPVAGAAPVAARIDAIDVLRGLALLGVLAINLDSEFRVPLFEQFLPPSAAVPWLDRAVAAVLQSAVEFKAFSLFALLFGLGLAIQFERLADDRLTLLVRRLLVLLVFGLIHLVLIWNGDILTEYAVAGFVVLPFLFASRAVVALAALAALALHLAMPWLPLPFSFPDQAWLATHAAAAHVVYGEGTFGTILAFQIGELPVVAMLHAYVFPRTVALMLIGALAWRIDLPGRGAARAATLRRIAAAAIGLGVVLSILLSPALAPPSVALQGTWATLAAGILPVVLAIGYAALVAWIVIGTAARVLLAWAAPVGRMAFTNYVAQSIVLSLLFYGYGLGLMGRLGNAAGFGIALAIFAGQALASRWWLRAHRFGPLEWLWRTLMYGERQAWRASTGCGAADA